MSEKSAFDFVCTPQMVALYFRETMLNGVSRKDWTDFSDEEFYVHARELLSIWVEVQMRKANGK